MGLSSSLSSSAACRRLDEGAAEFGNIGSLLVLHSAVIASPPQPLEPPAPKASPPRVKPASDLSIPDPPSRILSIGGENSDTLGMDSGAGEWAMNPAEGLFSTFSRGWLVSTWFSWLVWVVSEGMEDRVVGWGWAEWLSIAEFAYNNRKHASTGKSPFLINLEWHPNTGNETSGVEKKTSSVEELTEWGIRSHCDTLEDLIAQW